METVDCNFCGSARSERLYVLPDMMFGRPDAASTLVRCLDCGLVYQNPRPTPAEMAEHYPEEYDCYGGNPLAAGSWLSRQAYRYGLNKRIRTVTRYARGGRLLDVGCATGNFLLGMREAPGWTVQGVELSPHAAGIARGAGLDVFTGTLEQAAFPADHFDAVTLWDVFEHLHDPAAALQEVHRVLKPGGVLVMRVPNLDSWDARFFGPHWAGFEPPRHTYVFGIRTLRAFVTRAGFRIRRLACNIGGYPTTVLSARFRMTANGMPPERRDRVIRLLWSPVVRLLSAPFFFLLGLGLKGPLVIVTAQK